MKLTHGALILAIVFALAGSDTQVARAQSLLGDPDHTGQLDMLAHTCLPKTYTAGKTYGGVFIPAEPGTAVRFDCHVPSFKEQSFTVTTTGLYDIVVAGAEGGRGAFVRLPDGGSNEPGHSSGISVPARAAGGAGGVVRGKMVLAAGTVLYIDVGQRGGDGGAVSGGGGGGATFLLDANKNPIAVGAGGGGASWTQRVGNAPYQTLTAAQKIGPGQGGGKTQDNQPTDSGGGGGGAGFYQNGEDGFGRLFGLGHSYGGFDYEQGFFGGYGGSGLTQNDFGGMGGFGGGGGGGDGTHAGGGGGGGGYQGGSGGYGREGGMGLLIANANGGGGGTNYSGALLEPTTDSNADDGYVTIVLVR